MKKEIKARIDSHNKIVYASHADQVRNALRTWQAKAKIPCGSILAFPFHNMKECSKYCADFAACVVSLRAFD
jgi:hypothetical protein